MDDDVAKIREKKKEAFLKGFLASKDENPFFNLVMEVVMILSLFQSKSLCSPWSSISLNSLNMSFTFRSSVLFIDNVSIAAS